MWIAIAIVAVPIAFSAAVAGIAWLGAWLKQKAGAELDAEYSAWRGL